MGVGAAGVGGYTLGADWATKGFDYAKQNFKGFQDKANKAISKTPSSNIELRLKSLFLKRQNLLQSSFRLKDFTAPVRNNPTVKAVTNNRFVRGAGRVLCRKSIFGWRRLGALYNLG